MSSTPVGTRSRGEYDHRWQERDGVDYASTLQASAESSTAAAAAWLCASRASLAGAATSSRSTGECIGGTSDNRTGKSTGHNNPGSACPSSMTYSGTDSCMLCLLLSFLENTGKDKLCNVKLATTGTSPPPEAEGLPTLTTAIRLVHAMGREVTEASRAVCLPWHVGAVPLHAGADKFYSVWPEWVADQQWVNDFQVRHPPIRHSCLIGVRVL